MRHFIAATVASAALTFAASGQTVWYVDDDNCPGPGSGTEADPFCSIQDGIDAATDGDEILVAPGEYEEFVRLEGKVVNLHSSTGANTTTIRAPSWGQSVVVCDSGEGPGTIIDGFTITGPGYPSDVWYGGGMLIDASSPTIRNCIFYENNVDGGSCALAYGGGLASLDGSPLIEDCDFVGNYANGHGCEGHGGGAYCNGGSPTFVRCRFEDNFVTGGWGGPWSGIGGGLVIQGATGAAVDECEFILNGAGPAARGAGAFLDASSVLVSRCRFVSNRAEFTLDFVDGGGLYVRQCEALIVDCLFIGNEARNGGALVAEDAWPMIVNCTIIGNEASEAGGAVYSGSPLIHNSIVWSNTPDEIVGGDAVVMYSNVHAGYSGIGNIDADPLCDADGRLQPGSPCIDSGNAALLPPDSADLDGDGDTDEPLPLDLDGNPRVVGANVDMGGQYEFQGLPCPADLDGDGTVTVTDLTTVILAWGTPDADVTGDGTTDVQDLVAVINAWGPCG